MGIPPKLGDLLLTTMDNFSAGQFNKVFKMLGELTGEVRGINERLDKMNGSLAAQEKRISKLEAFRNRVKGEAGVISIIVAGGFSVLIYVLKRLVGN